MSSAPYWGPFPLHLSCGHVLLEPIVLTNHSHWSNSFSHLKLDNMLQFFANEFQLSTVSQMTESFGYWTILFQYEVLFFSTMVRVNNCTHYVLYQTKLDHSGAATLATCPRWLSGPWGACSCRAAACWWLLRWRCRGTARGCRNIRRAAARTHRILGPNSTSYPEHFPIKSTFRLLLLKGASSFNRKVFSN